MNRRLRFSGALLALLSFSAWHAEAVLASLCPPGMEEGMHMAEGMGSMAEAHGDVPAGHAGMGDPAPDVRDAPGTPDDAPRPDLGHCPFAAPGAGSTCVTPHVPAAGTAPTDPRLDGVAELFASDSALDPLLATGLFHPPRA